MVELVDDLLGLLFTCHKDMTRAVFHAGHGLDAGLIFGLDLIFRDRMLGEVLPHQLVGQQTRLLDFQVRRHFGIFPRPVFFACWASTSISTSRLSTS